jgi:gamma-glutamylcyclotransferase (GGCT)/AIG2-like uncharacterized protein YtfP
MARAAFERISWATTVSALDDGFEDPPRFCAGLVDTDHGVAEPVPHLLAVWVAGHAEEGLDAVWRDPDMKATLLGIHLAVPGFLDRERGYVVVGELPRLAVAGGHFEQLDHFEAEDVTRVRRVDNTLRRDSLAQLFVIERDCECFSQMQFEKLDHSARIVEKSGVIHIEAIIKARAHRRLSVEVVFENSDLHGHE